MGRRRSLLRVCKVRPPIIPWFCRSPLEAVNPDPARASDAPPAEPPRTVQPNQAKARGAASQDRWDDGIEECADGESAFKPLTREQAQDLRARLPAMSAWSLLTWQAAAGAVMVALWGLLSLHADKTWSALFGAVSVVLPNALMAWGMTRRPAMGGGTAVLSFMVWELIKIILAVAILVAVAVGFSSLSWPALLSTLVVTLKANWLALLRRGRIRK
ncbi:ATP synthase subunit I [Roseateles chitinivorans]|uniref:ATP synthase subunit I n=1 Tax=Roseateles chitinivorans TaxID=2917965 RepID=A0A2G9C6Y9_9BURK|nr:ATP synthase subunit I [Roseateles chitinivorans]